MTDSKITPETQSDTEEKPQSSDWKVFQGTQPDAKAKLKQLLSVEAPGWRQFVDEEQTADWKKKKKKQDDQYWEKLRAQANKKTRDVQRGEKFRLRVQSAPGAETDGASENPYKTVIEAVNAALYLRRPLMITGRPGSGKTSLAYALAHELNLGPVLLWPITTRSSLQKALYSYDAIARLQDGQLNEQLIKLGDTNSADQQAKTQEKVAADFKDIGQYIRLGPVGTAFLPSDIPRVLLIDEIDKSDINLPNELLNLLEEGEFEVPELKRLSKAGTEVQTVESDDDLEVSIPKGKVRCRAFPIIIMTSNGERDFPPAFYRRCLRVRMPNPSEEALKAIVEAHLGAENVKRFKDVIRDFSTEQDAETLSGLPTDQLLNLIYLLAQQPKAASQDLSQSTLKKLLFNPLDSGSDDTP